MKLRIAIAGHVDHGKSTLLGRLMAEVGAVSENRLKALPTLEGIADYAQLLDALQDERSQGITIDSARAHFRIEAREFLFLDNPGHLDFVTSMVSGSSNADAAILVLDAVSGIQENTRFHAGVLKLLGISSVALVLTRLDLVRNPQNLLKEYSQEVGKFMDIAATIPTSAYTGEGILHPFSWHPGKTLKDWLLGLTSQKVVSQRPLRFSVQGVEKDEANQRTVLGMVEEGVLRKGQKILFFPSGRSTEVATIPSWPEKDLSEANAVQASAMTMSDEIYVRRGEVGVDPEGTLPEISSRLQATVFWMGPEPLSDRLALHFRSHTFMSRVIGLRILGEERPVLSRGIARVEISLQDIAVLEEDSDSFLSRFALEMEGVIWGGGRIEKVFKDPAMKTLNPQRRALRAQRFIPSSISVQDKARRFRQKCGVLVITGARDSGKKPLAMELERLLFERGHHPCFFSAGNFLYGLREAQSRELRLEGEHLESLLDFLEMLGMSGCLTLFTIVDLSPFQHQMLKRRLGEENVLLISTDENPGASQALEVLQEEGFIWS